MQLYLMKAYKAETPSNFDAALEGLQRWNVLQSAYIQPNMCEGNEGQ